MSESIDSESEFDGSEVSYNDGAPYDKLFGVTYTNGFPSTNSGEEDCPICSENGGEFVKLPCSHIFHETCINKWLNNDDKHTTCPYCRSELEMTNEIEVDDFTNNIFDNETAIKIEVYADDPNEPVLLHKIGKAVNKIVLSNINIGNIFSNFCPCTIDLDYGTIRENITFTNCNVDLSGVIVDADISILNATDIKIEQCTFKNDDNVTNILKNVNENLKTLTINNNVRTNIFGGFTKTHMLNLKMVFKNITILTLDLPKPEFMNIDVEFENVIELHTENVVFNSFPVINKHVNYMNLHRISKTKTELLDMSDFAELETLYIEKTKIDSVLLPTNNVLIVLCIEGAGLKTINYFSSSLEYIDLKSNKLKILPSLEHITETVNHLNVSSNCLESINNLPKKVDCLNVSNNRLKKLDINNLTLNELRASNNFLETIEIDIRRCNIISLFSNKLRDIVFKNGSYNTIQSLHLSNNKLTKLHLNVAFMSLHIAHNKLKEVFIGKSVSAKKTFPSMNLKHNVELEQISVQLENFHIVTLKNTNVKKFIMDAPFIEFNRFIDGNTECKNRREKIVLNNITKTLIFNENATVTTF